MRVKSLQIAGITSPLYKNETILPQVSGLNDLYELRVQVDLRPSGGSHAQGTANEAKGVT